MAAEAAVERSSRKVTCGRLDLSLENGKSAGSCCQSTKAVKAAKTEAVSVACSTTTHRGKHIMVGGIELSRRSMAVY